MDDDCEEIYASGLLKRYCKHSAKLENLTLSDWAAWYNIVVENHMQNHQMKSMLMISQWKILARIIRVHSSISIQNQKNTTVSQLCFLVHGEMKKQTYFRCFLHIKSAISSFPE